MPEYLVRFTEAMAYQPEHPRVVHKSVSAMVVNAPTAEDAVYHAMRVTLGPGRIASVVAADEAPVEAAEVRLLISQRTPIPSEVVGAPA